MKFSAALLKGLVVAVFLAPPLLSLADCPEGVRPTTATEQQKYLATVSAFKAALPASVPGWDGHFDPLFSTAPSSVCKGSALIAGYDATFSSLEQRQKNQDLDRLYEAKVDALRKLPPEEQKQADDKYHQGSQLGYKSIAELKNKNQAEADRLRAEATKMYAASKAIQTAHTDKVFPQIKALLDEKQAAWVSPDVKVHLVGRDMSAERKAAKSEAVQIEGASAYFAPDKALLVPLGAGPDGQPVWARLEGDRTNTQAIAKLLGHLSRDGAAGQLQSKNN